jgi:ferredoxin-nitrite reductase
MPDSTLSTSSTRLSRGLPVLPPPPNIAEMLVDEAIVCVCQQVTKGDIQGALAAGQSSIDQISEATGACTGCGQCRATVGALIANYHRQRPVKLNPIEHVKQAKDGLDSEEDIYRHAAHGDWKALSEDDKHRFKWHGLFFRKQTPGHFMLRLRMTNGFATSEQFRVIADLSDEFGKGFADMTTRQQIQLRWFTLADVPEMWRRLSAVGLNSKQTGMDNVRNVCGCPAAGLTENELLDASPVSRALTQLFVGQREFTNLPRKFNVTITGCLENCCHPETQDIALVPARRSEGGVVRDGFNVLVGGKQGSGGYEPARDLNVFVTPEEAPEVCAEIVRIFRDHGNREVRTKARLYFLLEERSVEWFRAELERRLSRELTSAGVDQRRKTHNDHVGIHPQKSPSSGSGRRLYYAGLLVPVGRITSDQLRGVADLSDRYGTGRIRLTTQQNVLIPDIPEDRLEAFRGEPLLADLPVEPSPILRGLVACTGVDYCHMSLIDTKGHALAVAKELERRTAGRKVLPLTIHWSGCSAGCGLHQTATIGLQGCRTRVGGQIVEAAHVCVGGATGPKARVATDLMYDVPCDQLADALEPLVCFAPRNP